MYIYRVSTGDSLECNINDLELSFNFSDLGSFSFSLDVPRCPNNDKILNEVVQGGDNVFAINPLQDILSFNVSIDQLDNKSWSINLVSTRKSIVNQYKGGNLGSVIDYKDKEFYDFIIDHLTTGDLEDWHDDSKCFTHTITNTAIPIDNHESLSYVVSNSGMVENLASVSHAPLQPHNHDIAYLSAKTLLAQTSLLLFFKSIFKRFIGIDATVNIPNDLCIAFSQFINPNTKPNWGGIWFGQHTWRERTDPDFVQFAIPNYEKEEDRVKYIAHGKEFLHGDEVDNQVSDIAFVRSNSFSVQASGWYNIEFSTVSEVPRYDQQDHQYDFCDLIHYYGVPIGTQLSSLNLDAFMQEFQLCKVDAQPKIMTKVFNHPNTIMVSSRTPNQSGANVKVTIQAKGVSSDSYRSYQQFPVIINGAYRLFDEDDEDYLVCFRTGNPQRWLEQPGLYRTTADYIAVTSPYNASLLLPNLSSPDVQFADLTHDFTYTITTSNLSTVTEQSNPFIYTGKFGKQFTSGVKYKDIFGNVHDHVDPTIQRGYTENPFGDEGSTILDITTVASGSGLDEKLRRTAQFSATVFLQAGQAYEFRIVNPTASFNWFDGDLKNAAVMGVHNFTIDDMVPLAFIPQYKTDQTADNTLNAYFSDTFYYAFKDLSVDNVIKLVDTLNLSTTKDDFLHFDLQSNNSDYYDIKFNHIKVDQGQIVTQTEYDGIKDLDVDVNYLTVPLCTIAEGDPDFPAAPDSIEGGSASVPLTIKHTASYMTDGFKVVFPKYPVIFKQDLSTSGGVITYGIQGHRIQASEVDYQPRYLKPLFVSLQQLQTLGMLGVDNYTWVFDVLYKDTMYLFEHPYVFYQGWMYIIKEVTQYNPSTGLATIQCLRVYREVPIVDEGLHDVNGDPLYDVNEDKLFSND